MEDQQQVITVVCSGNICRSPMAERLLRHALEAETKPLSETKVYSAGVSAFLGDPPSRHAVIALQKVGLDLSDHRSRPLSGELMDITDLLLVMTCRHLEAVRLLYPDWNHPMHLFREWVPEGASTEVPDPFGASLGLYLETRDSLAEAVPGILHHLKTTLSSK